MHRLSRREALRGTGVAALAAGAVVLPIVSVRAGGATGEDAELRQLWAQYVAQLETTTKASDAHCRLREASGYDIEFESLKADYDYYHGYSDLHRLLWKKHGLEPSAAAATREDRKCRRIVKAIREAKAESLFGIGVKLSAWEDWDDISEDELAEVADSVRHDITALIGVDFIRETRAIAEEVRS